MCRKLCLIVLLLCIVAGTTQAALITAIQRYNSTNTAPAIAGPLAENSLAYVDRTHIYQGIPAYLLGAEYVMVANDDRDINGGTGYMLDVTLSQDATLYLLIDTRVGDGVKTDPATIGPNGMFWVQVFGWTYTGDTVSIDESANGSIDSWFSVFSKAVSAGTTTLYEQREGSLNMYGVVAVPEPATIALLGLGALSLLRRKR
jgi:hypothetical protein